MSREGIPSVRRIELQTTDSEQANAWVNQLYCGHVLHPEPGPAGFGLKITGHHTDRFRIETVRTAAPTVSSGPPGGPAGPLGAIQVRRGSVTASTDQLTAELSDRAWGVLDTSRPVEIVSRSDALVRIVVIDTVEITAVAEELLARQWPGTSGRAPEMRPEFPLAGPLDREHARYWNDVVDRVEYDLLSSDKLMSNPLIRHEASRTLATGMLVCFPNSALTVLLDPSDPGEPGAVRRAINYIDDHAAEPVSTDDVAAAARVSRPDLDSMFRRHNGSAPQEYVQRVRLERVHRDLQAADPAHGNSVASIAAVWGITDLDELAAAYRRRYGRSPTDSLYG